MLPDRPADVWPRLVTLLSRDERARAATFRFEMDTARYVLGKALLRTVLSRYAPVHPSDWSFIRTVDGRPELATPIAGPKLRFSVSYTRDAIACGVVAGSDFGLDMERIRPASISVDVIAAVCGVRELHQLVAASDVKSLLLYGRWTLKEAYAKACGRGLHGFVRDVEFETSADLRFTQATFAGALIAENGAWQFQVLRPTADHVLSIAIRDARGPLQIVLSEVTDVDRGMSAAVSTVRHV